MNKKTSAKTAPKRVVQTKAKVEALDERTRIHRAINWVVSFILISFAIWSILLNSEAHSLFKQTVFVAEETAHRLDSISGDLSVLKDLCQTPTVVIPTTPTDTQIIE